MDIYYIEAAVEADTGAKWAEQRWLPFEALSEASEGPWLEETSSPLG